VVVIARDIAIVTIDDSAGHSAEGIPDRISSAVFVRGTLDLVCSGRGSE
jgi:hypothetical protein